jgi:4-alpha-glucanotransferase
MRLPRASGILLHPTSLPGRFGIGDLGPSALEFLDVLVETGQRWWQILPVGPTGYGNSPYQSYSSYAGNPPLISPERLLDDGLLSASDWADYPSFPDERVEFDAVIAAKDQLLRRAFADFTPRAKAFTLFVEENAAWLDDFALFMALKESHGGRAWYDWEPKLVTREPASIARARDELAESVAYYQFVQYIFDEQWRALRAACESRSIGIIGDLPIFVAPDSADVWSRPDLFWLDEKGRATVVAGVPPDYFSPVGQLWGNPLYKWEAHQAEGFAWWISRLKAQTRRVDLVRLDHFRGFEAYWEIPAGSKTAENGRWAMGPGTAFLEALRNSLGSLPIVAEDLGDITTEVHALRDRFGLPGMRVMQFGFSGEPGTEFHLPYSFINHCLAYPGTHDNDTIIGWFTAPPSGDSAERAHVEAQRAYARRVLGSTGNEVHWDVIRAILASVADTVIIPLQDILGLGSAARMNVPGSPAGHWSWRLLPGQLLPQARVRLADMTAVYGRWNGTPPDPYGPPRRDQPAHPTTSAPTARATPKKTPKGSASKKTT